MILIDLNVILDVVQKRQPHYRGSAAVLDEIVNERVAGVIPVHAVTTIHYIVSRYQNKSSADKAVDWLLRYFDIAVTGRTELLQARSLGWNDFEDAVVAVAATSRACHWLVTRNVKDYSASPVPAVTPEEYLLGNSH